MTALLQWMTASSARAILAGGATALVASILGIAWLPAGFIVLASLAGGPSLAAAAGAGAALMLMWSGTLAFGIALAAGVIVAVLLPSYLAATALASTRSLSFVFQALTLCTGLLVFAIHALFGSPEGVLMPFFARLEPYFQQVAQWLTQMGIQASPQEIGAETARVGWRVFGWLLLLNALLAQFVGLWAFARLREPGLFGREFRRLKLGRFIAWSLVAIFTASLISNLVLGHGWDAADDVVFVLAGAFLIQALAVVHGLRQLQVIGPLPLILAYVAAALVPMALVGIGFADTWFRFRERFAPRQGV
ncbi:MAG: hypothetical protein ACRETI_06445 [Steroidobacteraceae bacterium]